MTVFVDTSAIVAMMDPADGFHVPASDGWRRLLLESALSVTTNYVALELHAVLQQRFGLPGVRRLVEMVLPALAVKWVDEATHAAAVAALLSANRRRLSLVDCTSFTVMREIGLDRAFTVDPHFAEHGFEVLPELPVRE
jgi:predicted nucleic acid-binding protein